jgi:hypothetical protein
MRALEKKGFMNHTRLESAVAVLLLAGSLGAASVCAGGTPGAVQAIAPPWVDGANVDGAAVEPFAAVSPSAVGRQQELDAEAVRPEDEESNWAPLEHLGTTPRHPHASTSARDTVGGGVRIDAGVQYPLTGRSLLGGELEVHHADALAARPDVEQYSFGIRLGP